MLKITIRNTFVSLLFLCLSIFSSCKNGWPFCPEKEKVDYKISSETSSIKLDADNALLNLRQAGFARLNINGSPNTLASLNVSNSNHALAISYPGCKDVHKSIEAELGLTSFDSVAVSNKSKIVISDFTGLELYAEAKDGVIEIKRFYGSSVDFFASLAGKIFIETGTKIKNAKFRLDSESDIHAASLQSEKAVIDIQNNSTCRIGEVSSLVVKGKGPGTVYYIGSPEITNENPSLITLVKIADEK